MSDETCLKRLSSLRVSIYASGFTGSISKATMAQHGLRRMYRSRLNGELYKKLSFVPHEQYPGGGYVVAVRYMPKSGKFATDTCNVSSVLFSQHMEEVYINEKGEVVA